ncbi:ribonuclease T2 [Tunturibacter empetritectus]|uniref:Ribonuclease T2 n=1 Tax=Tunturiibacter empetritectus TaxID=3069691 RepID=A0AAU7ZF02_9BACT
MKKITLPVLLALLLPLAACEPHPQPTSEPAPRPGTTALPSQSSDQAAASQQPFDYYLLNLSWSPEFCHSHPNATECAQRPAFVLHGLWPQNTNGGYPQNCSTDYGPRVPSAYSDIYPDAGLLRHEWRTHGTCSGLSPDAFFALARTAFQAVTIPPTLAQLDHQISLTPAQLIDLFQTANPAIPAASLAISCGNNYLTAVEVCLDKSAHPISCGPIRSCRANAVRITPP